MSGGKTWAGVGHAAAGRTGEAGPLRKRLVHTREWMRRVRRTACTGLGRLAQDALDVTAEGECVMGEPEQRNLERALRGLDGERLANAGRELFELGRQVFEASGEPQHPVGQTLTRLGKAALDRASPHLRHARRRQQDGADFHTTDPEATPWVTRRLPRLSASTAPTPSSRSADGTATAPVLVPWLRRLLRGA